jgi:hypothetical protein
MNITSAKSLDLIANPFGDARSMQRSIRNGMICGSAADVMTTFPLARIDRKQGSQLE